MWRLKMGKPGQEWYEWITVDIFETVTDAAKKIIEIERYPAHGVFFSILIETGPGAGSEQETFGHLEYIGGHTKNCYVVKRIQH